MFLRLDGRWFTPPLADGALPGVMRSVLLDDPSFGARERRLTRDDLRARRGASSSAMRCAARGRRVVHAARATTAA